MAIIPDGEKVLMTSADVNTTYGGSAALKELNKWYTIEDIAETIGGGGGGGLGSLKIVADGQIGNPTNFPMNVVLPIDVIGPGVNTFDGVALPSLNISANGGYGGGGAFTATTISFPELTSAYGLSLQSTTTVQTISAPDLVSFVSSAYFQSNSGLLTIDMPNLVSVGYLDVTGCPNLVNINFSSLVNGNTLSSNGDPGAFANITAANFPALRTCAFSGGGIISADLPALTTLTNISLYSGNVNLINLPGVVTVSNGYIDMQYKSFLNTFIIGTAGTIKRFGSILQGQTGPYTQPSISMANGSFNQATVDNWFIMLASLDGTNGTISANNGSLYIYGGSTSAPSQAGLDAKNILLTRGWNISNN